MKTLNALKILQFTDTHLFSRADGKLCGIRTTDSLKEVLQAAREHDWPFDMALVTGDMAQDETPITYEYFRDLFEAFEKPIYCLPGNHDDPEMMKKVFTKKNVRFERHVIYNNWQIIMLNSRRPNSNRGHLSTQELTHLEKSLSAHPELHALVCLHHNPVPLHSMWLDTMTLDNSEPFFDVLGRHPQVKAVVFGHVHQEFQGAQGSIPLLATPSTSIQFKPGSRLFALDRLHPGYRWFHLYSGGKIETGVFRLKTFSMKPDFSVKGY